MENEKKYIENIIISRKNDKNLFKDISTLLQNKIKTDTKIYKATSFALEVNVSNSLVTKYLKRMQIIDWSTLRYIHNNIIDNKFEKKSNVDNIEYNKIASVIEKSRKIMFLGVSSSWYSNNDFANKLARIDKWVLVPINKYEQIGLSNLLTDKDLLIVNSISLQHNWMIDVIKKTNAKTLIISSNVEKINKINCTFVINLEMKEWESTPTRTFTTSGRRKVLETYDNIYETIISKPENSQLLKLTAYN